MNNFLVISALGKDRPGIVSALSRHISDSGCNIEDSRMSVLGGEFAIMLLVSGNWKTIASLEEQVPGLQERLGLTIVTKRTEPRDKSTRTMPYAIDVVAVDYPGIVNQITGFFSSRNINIEEMETSSYAAPHTGTPMFSVHMEIGIPTTTQIAELREAFLDFCDELNMDAVLEPLKH